MKRFFYATLVLGLILGLFPAMGVAAGKASAVPDLDSGLPATVEYLESRQLNSFFDANISGLPNGSEIGNGLYAGWCIQNNIFGDLHNEPGTLLYSSLSPTLPADLAGLPWNEINYLLNHKQQAGINDVQGALWLLMESQSQDMGPEYNTEAARELVAEARAHPDYVPGPGAKYAVIIYSDGMDTEDSESFQEAIIEVTRVIPPPNQCEACNPTEVEVDFSKVAVGKSVEGMDKVAAGLNIDAKGDAVRIAPGESPAAYLSPVDPLNEQAGWNYGLAALGGFSDISNTYDIENHPATRKGSAHNYTFTFAPGVWVSSFSVRMLDFGDYNPTKNTDHFTTMTAYDRNDVMISQGQLSYTTDSGSYFSPLYGQLLHDAGDSANSVQGEPGKWTWSVSGYGITKIVLGFGAGYDPNIGFDTLSFTRCDTYSEPLLVTADFTNASVNGLVEGMGQVAPGLKIDATGDAVKIRENETNPLYMAYASPVNGIRVWNHGLAYGAGFTDLKTKSQVAAHQYTFTFDLAPGEWVNNFTLHMLDFGDYNPTRGTTHEAVMRAYDENGNVISEHWLRYTTVANSAGITSIEYGDLFRRAGNSASALPGQPGNWTWSVSQNGVPISRVVLTIDPNNLGGFDPNIGFDTLWYSKCTDE